MTSPAPRRVVFRVEYDGTGYHGWQAQPTGIPTIQGTLEAAFSDLLRHPVVVNGASRTDAGVHARDQVAALTLTHPITVEGLVKATNRRLPAGVAIRDAIEVEPDYNPRFENGGKRYCYRIYLGRQRRPLIDRRAVRVHYDLDLERMQRAARHLVGEHDFTSFAASDGSHKTAVRQLWRVELKREPGEIYALWYEGSAFLKYMIRNLSGTLIDVARGQIDPDAIPEILAGRSRSLAGNTAPPRGLTLERVFPKI